MFGLIFFCKLFTIRLNSPQERGQCRPFVGEIDSVDFPHALFGQLCVQEITVATAQFVHGLPYQAYSSEESSSTSRAILSSILSDTVKAAPSAGALVPKADIWTLAGMVA